MEQRFKFTDVRTIQFAWAAVIAFGVGCALDAVTGPLWVRYGLHATILEILGGGLSWLGFGGLWLLLPLSAFRPENHFYTRGDCSLRAKRFASVFGLLVFVHLWLIAIFAHVFRGGW